MIRVVWGRGRAPTAKASFDAALVDANVHQYNLRELSSVIPADATLEAVGSAPDLGPAGNALEVVLARQTSPPGARASAGLAWARGGDGVGVFYEEGDRDPETVRELLHTGIERGCKLRGFGDVAPDTRVVTADSATEEYTTGVVLAAYGESTALL